MCYIAAISIYNSWRFNHGPRPDARLHMSKIYPLSVLLLSILMTGHAYATYPVYADGDLAPLGNPDGSQPNAADLLIAQRIDVGLDGQAIQADLVANLLVVGGQPGDMVFDLAGSTLTVENVRVQGTGESAWSAGAEQDVRPQGPQELRRVR